MMALMLWVMWQYLGGRWWPRTTAEARRRNLRALPVSRRVFLWALVAGKRTAKAGGEVPTAALSARRLSG
jgi:hypothetical protein